MAARVTLTINQAVVRCQVSRRTVYNWLEHGKVEYTRTAGGSVRIFEDSLFRAPPDGRWRKDATRDRRSSRGSI